jgi:hypothetical protein
MALEAQISLQGSTFRRDELQHVLKQAPEIQDG